MSIKRILSVLSLSLPLCLLALGSPSGRKVEVLLVPAQPNFVRVGLDVHEREGMVLMAYAPESAPDSPFLHVWNGIDWIRVPAERYASGTFLTNRPTRVLVVGPDNDLTASLIEQAIGWTPEVLNLAPGSVTDLINGLGRQLQFNRSDWKWFADKYDLELRDLNRNARQTSWYDSHKASELPPPENPLRKHRRETETVPSTSLEPIPMPGEVPMEGDDNWENVEESELMEVESPDMSDGDAEPEAFSIEVE